MTSFKQKDRKFDLKKKSSRKASISDLCRRTPQHHLSAMPPCPQKGKNHLLGIPNDATFNYSYHLHQHHYNPLHDKNNLIDNTIPKNII